MKTNTHKRSLLFLATLIGVTWTFVATPMSWADMPRHSHDGRPNAADFIWHVLMAKETLGLGDEQETRLMAIAVAFKKEDVKRTAEVELAEIDLHQLLHRQAKQVGGDDIEAAVRKMYALKADRRLASIKTFQEARNVLTPEQQKKMKELHNSGMNLSRESTVREPVPLPTLPPHGFMERRGFMER